MATAEVQEKASPTIRLAFSPEKKYSDVERWNCIYPAYLNSKRTIQEGRRLAKEKCVPDPTYQEIHEVLKNAGLPTLLEQKLYPRKKLGDSSHVGRIRIQLKNDDGSPVQEKFPDVNSVLLYLGEVIPKLKTRVGKGSQAQSGSGSSAVTGSGSAGSLGEGFPGGGGQGGGGGKKKKGKR